MSSANSPHWKELMGKKKQVEGLSACLVRVVAAAFGADQPTAAAAARAAASDAAGPALAQWQMAAAGRTALAAADAQSLLTDAQALVDDMPYWDVPVALRAWLLLRAGELEAAAAASAALSLEQKGWGIRDAECDWRWWLQCQVNWHKGDLTAAQELLLDGLQKLDSSSTGSLNSGSSGCLATPLLPARSDVQQVIEDLKQLVDLKTAGNTAVSAKKYEQALEHYSKALMLQPSAGFAALLHSNRAAALQSMDRLAEALADCGRAIALDPTYSKAYSR